jgi:hypothetical protein
LLEVISLGMMAAKLTRPWSSAIAVLSQALTSA